MASEVSSLLADISRIRTQQEQLAEASASETTTAKLAELKRQEQQQLVELARAAADAAQQQAQDAAETAGDAAEDAHGAQAAGAADTAARSISDAGATTGGPTEAATTGGAATTAEATTSAEAATTAQAANGTAPAIDAGDQRPAKRARSETDGPVPTSTELLQQLMAGGGLPDTIISDPGPDAVQNAPMETLLTTFKLLDESQLLPFESLPSGRTAPRGPFLLTEDLARKMAASLLAHGIRAELQSVGTKLPLGRLLKTQTLRDEAVQYVRRDVPLGQVLRTLNGKLTGEGGILCGCEECNGRTEVPPSVFEEHSGSLAKKPADNIFVLSYGVSLKDLLTSVTAEQGEGSEGQCLLCGQGEDLLQCSQCDYTFHAACCDWPELSAYEVPCPSCLMQEAAENVALVRGQQEEEGVPGAEGRAAGDDSATESDTEMLDAVKVVPAKAAAPVAPRKPVISALPLQLRKRG